MLFKSTVLLAVAAVAAAQNTTTGTYIQFTNPVADTSVYPMGSNQTFSWNNACVAPNTRTSTTPTAVTVDLLNAANSNAAFYVSNVATIDCTKSPGNVAWTVPKTLSVNTYYSLRINVVPDVSYSGRFMVTDGSAPAGTSSSTPAPTGTGKSAANSIAPAALSAAAIVGTAALMLL